MGGCCCKERDYSEGDMNEPFVKGDTPCSTRTTSLAPVNDALAADIRNYELVAYIGRGAFAEVSLARHRYTHQMFAIKRINKKRVQELGFAQQTATERALLGELEHPFLVKLQQAFQSSEYLYLVLDFAPGGNLLGLIQRNLSGGQFKRSRHLPHLPIRRESGGIDAVPIYFYAVEISLMLMHIHQEGYLYRDLKPENVLLSRSGHILLTDFGVARVFSKKELYLKRSMRKKTALLTALVAEEEAATTASLASMFTDGEQRLGATMDVVSMSRALTEPDSQRNRSYSTSTEASDTGSLHSGDSGEGKKRGLSGFLGLFGGREGALNPMSVANVSGDSFDDAWDECVVAPTEADTPNTGGEQRPHASFVGTPNYMAPEVVGTPTEPPSTPSDWWSLGCLLFELATGRQAFQAESDYMLYKKLLAVDVGLRPSDFASDDTEEAEMLRLLQDLIFNGLLVADPSHRLGADTIFSHPFFSCRHFLDSYGIAVAPHLGSVPDCPEVFLLASPEVDKLSLSHGSHWGESVNGISRGQMASRQHFVMYRALSHFFVDETVRRLWDGACAKATISARGHNISHSLVSLSTFDPEDGVFTVNVCDVIKGASCGSGPLFLERPYIEAPFVPVIESERDVSHFTTDVVQHTNAEPIDESLFEAFDSSDHAAEMVLDRSPSQVELSTKSNSRSGGSETHLTSSQLEFGRTVSQESSGPEHNYVGFSYAGREAGVL